MEILLQDLKEELLRKFETESGKRNTRQDAVLEAFAQLDADLATIMERYIRIAQKSGFTIPFMAESYAFMLDETENEERYFYQEGHYRYSKLEEVIHKVYDDEAYMKKYMTGLAVSILLWPQHKEYLRFFRAFLQKYGKSTKAYLEIGAGHGIFCSEALRQGSFSRYDIVDISETSLTLTRQMTEEYAEGKEIRFIHTNFLEYQGDKYGAIVIGEVLEHIEGPQAFVNKCAELLDADGRVYLTTCLNAPAVDHISLFSVPEDVEKLFDAAGLAIDEKLYIPYKGTTIERCMRQKLPVNVAYILKHK